MTVLNKQFWVAVVPLAFTVAVPAAQAQRANSRVEAYVLEARTVAQSKYGLALHLDTRDLEGVAAILEDIRGRHAKTPLNDESLAAEVRRWGAVLGEIQLSIWGKAHWGPSKERNQAYSHSVYVPLEGGGWLESNEFDLVEGLITGKSSELMIRQILTLHFLD